MCDIPEVDPSGMDPTGFLFGDTDHINLLEDDGLLDAESKQLLCSLSRLGLGSIISEVIEETKAAREEEDIDYSQKSPSAVDFFDIEDLADDFSDIDITNEQTQDKLETAAAGDVKKDCPQPEVVTSWSGDSQCEEQPRNDDGYEGDMKCDGALMPPPATIPSHKSEKGDARGSKRLATPLDAMLPSKYANVDVT